MPLSPTRHHTPAAAPAVDVMMMIETSREAEEEEEWGNKNDSRLLILFPVIPLLIGSSN